MGELGGNTTFHQNLPINTMATTCEEQMRARMELAMESKHRLSGEHCMELLQRHGMTHQQTVVLPSSHHSHFKSLPLGYGQLQLL